MKFTLILLGILSSVNVQAASLPWQDLEEDTSSQLTQSLALQGTHGEVIDLARDRVVTLEDVWPLEGLSVVNYIFRATPCETPELESEMAIILPNGNSPTSKAEVGVTYSKGCRLDIYVETKDLAKPSFFRPTSAR